MKVYMYLILSVVGLIQAHAQTALSSDFTYQGNLTLNGVPVDGVYDFDLYLFDAAVGGNEVQQLTVEDANVVMGFFSIELDFGDGPFTGNQMWMEIRIREGASIGGFQQLLPRQKINSTPYAIHAQFVGANAVGTLEIQDGSVSSNKLANNAVTSVKIADGEVKTPDLEDGAVDSSKIADLSISSADLANSAITTTQLANGAVTQTKLASDAVGAGQVISSEVQLRLSGGCTQGQYVSAVAEDGSIVCADAIDASARGVCKSSAGDAGIVINGVCVLSYSNQNANNWSSAVNACSALGGDLCSVSQYQAIRNKSGAVGFDLFYNGRAVWSNDFSDNDSSTKNTFLNSSDNPNTVQVYGYACCGNVLPEPSRSMATDVNGVKVAYVHDQQDTVFGAASNVCTSMGADLCTKSQYVALNDANLFDPSVSRATAEMSDNDSNSFDDVVGSSAADNPSALSQFAYACCGMSTKAVDLSCPGNLLVNGVCVGTINDTADTNFFDAARACHSEGANLCSKSQMQSIRNVGQFFGTCWTNDGADNDGGQVGGLAVGQADNPDPANDSFGYACCY